MATRYQRQADAPSVRMGLVAAASVDPFAQVVEDVEKFSRGARVAGAEQKAMADVAAGKVPDVGLAVTDAQEAYNQAAARAYEAKTSLGIRAEAAKLASQFDGRQPGHVQAFEETFDAYSRSLLASVPAALRPRVEFEVQQRRAEVSAQVRDRANRFEFDRNVGDINAGIEADLTDAAAAARDGRADIVAATVARTDERIDSLVALGVMGPGEAEQKKREARSGIEAEAIFGDALRSGSFAPTVAELQAGGPLAANLTVQQRDALVAKLSAEAGRRRAEAARAEAEDASRGKEERELLAFRAWASIYSPESKDRIAPEQVVALVETGALSPTDGEQMIRTLATSKEARTDLPTLASLDQQIDEGVDVSEQITAAISNGTLHPEDAASLRSRNASARRRSLPDPINETRRQVRAIYSETSPFGTPAPGEAERKVEAVRFYDEQVRAAPPGINPETGAPFAQEVAERTFNLLRDRHRKAQGERLRAIPPRSAVIVPPSPAEGFDAPPRMDVAATVGKLRTDHAVGLLTDDEYDAELALVEAWQQAGLVVK